MHTKKNVLEKMSSQELEKYIKPDSKFVPQAVQYAYEILESRGRKFTNEESAQIISRTSDLDKKQEITIHPNHTKASHIMYLSGALGIAGFIWAYDPFNSGLSIFVAATTLAFVFGMGYFIGKGNEYAKYLLIITFVLGLFGLPSILNNLFSNPVLGIISSIQTILQVWVIILLVKIPKKEVS